MSQASPRRERYLVAFGQQLLHIKADIRLLGLDRLARPTQRETIRARKGSQPCKSVMRDEQASLHSKANGNEPYKPHIQASAARADYLRELPSLSEEAKERQVAEPSSSQPSSARARVTHADASKGVPVFVMLPLDTVSSSKT